MSAAIEAKHLSKWYGEVSALNNISVTVPAGVTGLLGPNGAGKSTFMKLVAGQLKPSQGSVRVLGEPVWGNPGIFARIGFCPEHDAFYERMTGRRWLAALVGLNGYDRTAADAAAARALAAVGMEADADRRIAGYSRGMRQRLKLAQAFMHEPELLVLDEPLAAMDPSMRRATIEMIRGWGRAGRSVLVSSHVLHEIEAMTATILLMDRGRVLAEGDVGQIRALIDQHPHTVVIRADDPRRLAQRLLSQPDVVGLRLEGNAVVTQTSNPDAFYEALTSIAASDPAEIHEISSPDDNLQAVFQYLVKR